MIETNFRSQKGNKFCPLHRRPFRNFTNFDQVQAVSYDMSLPRLLSTTVLGKRKATKESTSLVLHLASSPEPSQYNPSDSDFELSTASIDLDSEAHGGSTSKASPSSASLLRSIAAARPLIVVNGELVEATKRKYRCPHAGCTKAYTKPSRLEEHERSHTGEVCLLLLCRSVVGIKRKTISGLLYAIRATNLIFVRRIFKLIRDLTCPSLRDLLAAQSSTARKDFGPPSILKCTRICTRGLNLIRSVCIVQPRCVI